MSSLTDSHGLLCGGRQFTAAEIAVVCEVVTTCRGLSRKELANTISELLGWSRPNGSLKEAECLLLLARLEAQGLLQLPAKQQTRPAQYGITPLLVETFVDAARYHGGCYRAANWEEIGETSGRGRDDRQHRQAGQPKRVLVYRLRRDAQAQLRGERQRS